jgi:hypothetical protein
VVAPLLKDLLVLLLLLLVLLLLLLGALGLPPYGPHTQEHPCGLPWEAAAAAAAQQDM